jgi:predicted dehydrogenase
MGEGVHFFDFIRWLTDSIPVSVSASAIDRGAAAGIDPDNAAVTMTLADGSVGVVVYNSQGGSSLGKERVEIFGGAQSVVIDDFAAVQVYTGGRADADRRRTVDKGHAGILDNFHRAITGTADLGVTAVDGYWATWCAHQATLALRACQRGDLPA